MKTCTKCQEPKADGDFPYRNKALGTKQGICKVCTRKRSSLWFQSNRARAYESSAPAQQRWRAKKKAENQKVINDIKSKPCQDCGLCFHSWQMQFDHVRGEKKFNIATAVHQSYAFSLEAILEEVAKCDLVCANCHADRTYRRSHEVL